MAGNATLAMDLLVKELAHVALFQGLTDLQLSEIARRAERVIFHPGAMIIEENAEADAAILIVSGEAVRVSGPELKSRAEPVPVGSMLGEFAMLVETTYSSTIVARGPVRALRLTRDELHAQMVDDLRVAERLTENIVARLSRFADELRQVDAALAGSHVTHKDESQVRLAIAAH